MKKSLKNYTLRHLIFALLAIIAIWAILFYAYIVEEVYDNIDDGLKNQKIQIIRATYDDDSILQTNEYGISQFKITPIVEADYIPINIFINTMFYMEYDEEKEPYRLLTTAFIDKYGKHQKLEIRTSSIEEDEFKRDLLIALSVLYVCIIISIFFINRFVLQFAWKPFFNTLDLLKNYKINNKPSFETKDTNIIEFIQLNEELKKMIDRNEQLFNQQKQFIENASHELQTPLAITINQLDLFMENENLTEKQFNNIDKAKRSLYRMVNLNKSLLMLSKIENKQFSELKEVNFSILIEKLLEDLEDFIEYKKINIQIEKNENFIFMCNEYLAEILIINLLKNAIRYNYENGKIIIEIFQNKLIIKNTAEIGVLDNNKIFNRFYKNSTNKSSSGLGLAIVKTIIDQYNNITLSYIYENDLHQFKIIKNNS